MSALVGFIRGVDALNEWIGRTVSWLTLGCVLTCFAVVVLRYAFGVGFPWLQELYVWQHAAVFMAGAGYTLLHGGHVSVDVLLFLDGVYRVDGTGAPVFRQSAAPSAPDLQALLERIALRIGQTLEKRGLIERDIENAWLAEDGEGGPLDDLSAIRSRTASRSAREPGRSCSRCRRCRPDRRSGWTIPAAWRGPAGSPCMPASTSRPGSAPGLSACAAM